MAFCILSIDGGGVYGAVSAVILKKILDQRPDFLNDTDLIAGTSVGGLLAAVLASGEDINELIENFPDWSKKIFSCTSKKRKLLSTIGLMAEHDNQKFKKLLLDRFGDLKLKDLKNKVVIPAFDLYNDKDEEYPTWKSKFFHNFEGNDFDGENKVIDVILRTTAAPIMFSSYQGYIDGALVTNNPSLCAIAQTQDERCLSYKPNLNDIRVLSLGIKQVNYVQGCDQKDCDWGFAQWGFKIINLIIDRDEEVVNYQCKKLIGKNYFRFAPVLNQKQSVGLDDWASVPMLMEVANQVDISSLITWLDSNWN